MSHFTVLVLGENPEEQLAPFHEFECTGEDNEYVQEIDKTDEARTEFLKSTDTRYRKPDGTILSAFDDNGEYLPEFLRDPTPEEVKEIGSLGGSGWSKGLSWTSGDWLDGQGWRTKIVNTPEGWEKLTLATPDVETFAQFITNYYGRKVVPFGKKPNIKKDHKYGWTEVDENGEVVCTVDRTNPNSHWDWYQIGGRWTGFFKLKPGTIGTLGTPSLLSMSEAPGADRADYAYKGQIDIEGMRNEAAEKAANEYDLVHSILASVSEPFARFNEILAKHCPDMKNIDDEPEESDADSDARNVRTEEARTEYRAQPGYKALHADERTRWFWNLDVFFDQTRVEYIQAARDRAFTTFAYLKDGKWIEKDDGGWSEESPKQAEWNAAFTQMIDSLPDNTLMTLVDCHT